LGMTVGSFTAMNLTGGNPITKVGLAHYHDAIHRWFTPPPSLVAKVEDRTPWDVPARGETVEVPPEVEQKVTDALRGAYFGLAEAFAAANPGFPVPRCIAEHGRANRPFDIPVILTRDVEGVRVLTIRRPKVLNALDEAVFAELERRFLEADADPAVQAVVLTG